MIAFKELLIIVGCLATMGCASYRPIIDTRNVNMNQYESDLRDCQQYAQQQSPGASAAFGEILGGLFGYAISRAAGSDYDAAATARVGAVAGGAGGAAQGAQSQVDIIRNCLRGRGYSVLR